MARNEPSRSIGGYRLVELVSEGPLWEEWRGIDEAGTEGTIRVRLHEALIAALRATPSPGSVPDHRNLLHAFDCRLDDDPPSIVRPSVDGCTLADFIVQNGPYEPRSALRG